LRYSLVVNFKLPVPLAQKAVNSSDREPRLALGFRPASRISRFKDFSHARDLPQDFLTQGIGMRRRNGKS
jgi:hypothetical protein